jgi:transposase-like protein
MSFIKLDRKIIDSEVFAHDGQLRFWLWLLLRANYKKSFAAINTGSGKKTVEVGRGQLLFGRNSAGSELGVNSSTLYKWLKMFEKKEMISSNSNKHFTVVTICKYDEYQSEERDEVTSREQASNKPVTNQCPTSNTSKEVKEVKEYNIPPDKPAHKNFIPPTIEEVREYFTAKNIDLDAEEFIAYYEARGWVSKGSKIKSWKACITTWKKNAGKFDDKKQGLNYLSGKPESDLIAKINGITDEFLSDVEMSKFQFNDQFTVLYHTELQKFISWDTMVKCPKIGKVARSIFTARSINHLLTPATYGQRNKTA